MQIRPFAVEQWMNAHETRCRYNLAETCVDSLTVAQLLELAGTGPEALRELLPMRLTYGAIEGSMRLRGAIAALYAHQAPENVLLAHGAIGANHLVYQGLVGPGDRVLAIVPNYQQHYSIPESLGARVERFELRAADGWLPDLDALRRRVTPGTRLISLSNPNNPTGSLLGRPALEALVQIAQHAGAWILCDEVYRGLTQEDLEIPSIADLYDRGISTGSMSKAFSLAGLRLGWITAPREVLAAAELHRDYNTISVGMIDDFLACLALENAARLLERSRGIVRANLALLDDWIATAPGMRYVRPRAGTTALLEYGLPLPSREFCLRLLEDTGVLFTPGSALEAEGTVRIGYANAQSVLREGLVAVSGFLRRLRQAA